MDQRLDQVPAAQGWYQDPGGPGSLRWWDGRSWTLGVTSAEWALRAPRPYLAAHAPLYNAFIWLIVSSPLLQEIAQLILTSVLPALPGWASYEAPWYFYVFVMGCGFLFYAGNVVLARFDRERLKRAGLVRPFHWAWTFLGPLVYVIGRAVIIHKAAPGKGLTPIWILAAVWLTSTVLGITVSAFH